MSSTPWTKLFKGIRFRLTVVYSTLFGLFICVFAYVISDQQFQADRAEFDTGLLNYGIDLSEYSILDESNLKIDFKLPDSEDRKAFPFLLKQTYYTVRNFKGEILATGHNNFPFNQIPFDPKLTEDERYTYRFVTFKLGGETFRALNMRITDQYNREMILQVTTSLESLLEKERNHLIVISFLVPFLIIGSSFFSFLISGNALAPIKSLTDTANRIAVQNLSLRVPEVNTGDEVEELAKTLNNLLGRMEKSFKAQEAFVSNASHQLNTPLAIIKGELDVLESKPRTKEEHTKFLESLREEIERLVELVNKMLLVSRVESGFEKFVFSPQRLDEILLTTSSRLRMKANEKKINIRFNIDEKLSPQDLVVMGDKQLLDSIFENLLENSIKYSPEKSSILLDIKLVDDNTEVWIEDEGPGIDKAKFQTILTERYERDSKKSIPGTGIGLPIAHKIAQFHNAQIQYEDGKKGSLFKIRFEKNSSQQA